MKNNKIKGSIAAAFMSLMLLVLAACGGSLERVDLSDVANAGNIACADIVDASNEFSLADSLKPENDERKDILTAWNIQEQDFAKAKKAVEARSNVCNGEAAPSATTVAAKAADGTGTPVPGDCPAEFKQKFDPNEKGNFSSDGVENSDDVRTLLGHDARYTAFVGHLMWPSDIKNDYRPLVDKNKCLSREGRDAFYQIKGALSSKDVKVNEDAKAPADSYNTAMKDNRGVVDPKQGVGGNRDAVQYTFPNGNKLTILKRCANPALKGPGKLPKGPTDHQRPPDKEKTPSPSTTPPGSTPPPPGGEDSKKPNDAPGNGGAGDGGSGKYGGTGSERQTAAPVPNKPEAGDPPDKYTPPPQPKPTGAPAGSTPTKPATTPPPEPSANPTGGGGNQGDPGGF